MAVKGIVIEGTKELIDQLRKLPRDIGQRTGAAFNEFAEQVIKESFPLVPYDPKRKEGTHLRDTGFIRKAEAFTNPTTWLGYKAPHAFLVENDIAGKRPAEHHSTPGTGAKYLARPFKQRQGQLESKIEKILEEIAKRASS